jgi:O-antigen/teichoic acid export membrane protein
VPARTASRHGLLVAAATAVANALAYGLSVVVSRRLGPQGFGEVAPLLAVVLVASVPGQALQAGAARRAAGSAGADPATARLLLRALLVGVAVALALVLVAPALRALLDLPAWEAVLWTAGSLLPLTVCFGCLGILQGGERFVRLSAALVVVQAGRLAGGAGGVLLTDSAAGAMAGTAVGLLAAAAACVLLCRPGRLRAAPPVKGLLSGLAHDSAAVLSVLVLTNLDVILARSRLSASDAGLYAAGALLAKIAFFGPSFVAVVLYPRLARPADRPRALRLATAALSIAALVAVVGTALAADAVSVVLGDDYAGIEPVAWLFAAAGSALAGVFLLVQAGLAVRDHRLAVAAWLLAAVEVAVVLAAVGTLTQLVTVVVVGAVTLLAVGVVLELRSSAARPADDLTLATPGATVA